MTPIRHKKLRDKIINEFVVKLEKTQFYKCDFLPSLEKCLNKLSNRRSIGSIICYGLGSFCDGISVDSRYQLALLILTHRYLKACPTSSVNDCIDIFDPAFKSLDVDTLLSFTEPRFRLIEENEYCARQIECINDKLVTLVYMPHLDKFFYNNLLGANWSPRGLRSLVVLGNCFSAMIDRETDLAKLKSELYYLSKLVQGFESNKKKKSNKPANEEELKEKQDILIEIEFDDSELSFNNFAFHLINDIWIQNNANIIQQSRHKEWQRFVPTTGNGCEYADEDNW